MEPSGAEGGSSRRLRTCVRNSTFSRSQPAGIELRNKKKSEECEEDVEKIKKKKNKKDGDLRKHTEKDDGRKKRRILKCKDNTSKAHFRIVNLYKELQELKLTTRSTERNPTMCEVCIEDPSSSKSLYLLSVSVVVL